jgi:hypothetical protein
MWPGVKSQVFPPWFTCPTGRISFRHVEGLTR